MSLYPPGFEDDDLLRSTFIRQLTLHQLEREQVAVIADGASRAALIPRTLLRYWHDPNNIPKDVRRCLDSWEVLREEGFTILMFDDASARAYISARYGRREAAAFDRCRHPAMRSDYLRMCFVLAEGGLYVDADDVLLGNGWEDVFRSGTLKVQPLCYDLGLGRMVAAAELRRSDLPTERRIFYVNNNPIAAPAGHPVLRRALARATTTLLGAEPTPEIQSTTGPGNLTASLAAHAQELLVSGTQPDFELLLNWDSVAEQHWDLAYRRDERNWRNMAAAHRTSGRTYESD